MADPELVRILKEEGVEVWNELVRGKGNWWRPDLGGASFADMCLKGVKLAGAILEGADFARADLSRSKISTSSHSTSWVLTRATSG